ncbi:MAG: hypothetical protein ACW99G_12580 [Candidatus Thorarchaeota archaeon]|jgi:hypothetical protein
MAEHIVLDDLVILGRACPERIRDGRTTVCTAGYSETHGFVRIYPTRTDMPLNRWNVVRVPVERNPQDTRTESWKIQGSKMEWEQLSEKIEVIGRFPRRDQPSLVQSLVEGCVKTINDEKRSLGIVRPTVKKCYFSQEERFDPMVQQVLWGPPPARTKRTFPVSPKVQYRCSDCKIKGDHDQTVLEWGFYQWMKKNPEKKDQVWDNTRIHSPDYDVYFFVGNQANRRTSFMIISVLRFKRDL